MLTKNLSRNPTISLRRLIKLSFAIGQILMYLSTLYQAIFPQKDAFIQDEILRVGLHHGS
jgi:hypothetical protein